MDPPRFLPIVATLSLGVAPLRAEPRRLDRPLLLSGGVSVVGVRPLLVAQVSWNPSAFAALLGDAGYFTTGDRLFGPTLFARAGGRYYFLDGLSGPFVGGTLAFYNQWEVDQDISDAVQGQWTGIGVDASIGHELATLGGFSWTVEGGTVGLLRVAGGSHPAFLFLSSAGDGSSGATFHVAMTFGYRFQ